MESKLNSQNSVIGKQWKIQKTTSIDMEQPKTRWTKEELVLLYGEDKYNIAEASRQVHQNVYGKEMGDFILVPHPTLQMISIISEREWDKGKNGVGEIMHDKLFGE